MDFKVKNRRNATRLSVIFGGAMLLVLGLHGQAQASPGTDLFQGFRQHVHAQIIKDKQEFSLADTCTAWFYKQQQHTKPKTQAQKVRFMVNQPIDSSHECVKRYPGGLEAAREGFGKAQQELSLSLTFFQMVLVGDGDDNKEYNLQETRDVVESLGLPFFSHQPVTEYIVHLTGLFDRMRANVQFQGLMDGMQALMNKGYRFTAADQEGLNEELK
ncbi:MAG: hypothetical protein R3B74_07115 [Nitrospirales bacterium]|nr:hypothetical protein [Nitrospirales bacterium]